MIMRQFKLYLNLLLLMAIGMVASCNDDFDRPPMMIPHAAHIDKVNTTILDLKTKYWKEDKNYIDTIKLTEAGDSVVIKGRVVSSDESGNIYKNLVIQDETAAITISINGNSLYNTYRIGQEIVLPVTGLFIGKYNTLQQLGYPDYSETYGWQATFLPLAMFQEAAELNGLPNAAEIDTISVKMAELPTTPDGIRKMQSQLVRFDGVSFVEADGKTTFSESESSTSRNLKDEDSGNTIIVRNSNYANFKSDILPLGVGSVVGILSYYSGAWQLLLRDVDDCIGFDTTIKGSKCVQITDDLQLQVVVCGNDLGGNIYKQLAVQDATGGIIVGINATDLCAYLPVGQKLLINLKGLYIGGYGTQAQIGALYNGSLGRMDADTWEQHVRLVEDSWVDAVADTIDFVAGADQLLQTGRIVRIAAATVTGTGTQTLAPDDGTVSLTSNCANRIINGNSKLLLRTSTYSDFASLPIPGGKVDIYGVCTIFNGSWQILMRTESDLQTSR